MSRIRIYLEFDPDLTDSVSLYWPVEKRKALFRIMNEIRDFASEKVTCPVDASVSDIGGE